jgi:CheY-like chemotaxis protein
LERERQGASRGAPLLASVTGYGQEGDRRQFQDAGFDLHLIKPVDPAILKPVMASEQGT